MRTGRLCGTVFQTALRPFAGVFCGWGGLALVVSIILMTPADAQAQAAGASEERLAAANLSPRQEQIWDRIAELAAIKPEANPSQSLIDWSALLTEAQAAFDAPSAAIAVPRSARAYALGLTGKAVEAESEMAAALGMLAASPDAEPLQEIEMLWAAAELDKISGRLARAGERLQASRILAAIHVPADTDRLVTLDAGIAQIDQILGRHEAALARLQAADVTLRDRPDLAVHKTIVGVMLSESLASLGRDAEAAQSIHRTVAEASAALGPDHETTLIAVQALQAREMSRGNLSVASDLAAGLVDKGRAGRGLPSMLPVALNLYGVAAQARGWEDEAAAAYREAWTRHAELFGAGSYGALASAVNLASLTATDPDRATESLDVLAQARAAQNGAEDPSISAQMDVLEAQAHLSLGRLDEAIRASDAALDRLDAALATGSSRMAFIRRDAQIMRALAQARSGAVGEARDTLSKALAAIEADFRPGPTSASDVAGSRESRVLLGRILEGAYLVGERDLAFRAAQGLMNAEIIRAADGAWRRLGDRQSDEAEILKSWRRTSEARRALDRAHLENIAGGNAAAIARSAEAIDANQAALAAIEADLASRHRGYQALTLSRPLTLDEAQDRLSPGEAMIVSAFAGRGVVTLAITPDRVAWGRVETTRGEVARAVTAVHAGLSQGARDGVDALAGRRPAPSGFDRQAAHRLYRILFSPDIEKALAQSSELIVSAEDGLNTIPFAALVMSDDIDTGATPWLIRRFAVRVSASLGSGRRPSRPSTPRLFAAGAPRFSGSSSTVSDIAVVRGGTMDPNAIKALPALPFAAREMAALDAAFPGGTVLTGDQATETAIRNADLSRATVVVFATHGLVAGDLGGVGEPSLVLTPPETPSASDDGLLTASEAAMLNLDADWVVLSACNTAAGDRLGAPGFTGLARAFLFAGGRNILASHWPVRDDAAARLSVRTITAAAEGQTPAQALRTAMLALMEDPGVPNGSDPSVWAAFTLIGS